MTIKKRVVILGFIFMLSLLTMTLVACEAFPVEPTFNLVIENQTTQVLTINVAEISCGTIEPGKQITHQMLYMGQYLVVAKNSQGQIVYSRTYTLKEMEHVKGTDTFKVVIPPSPE